MQKIDLRAAIIHDRSLSYRATFVISAFIISFSVRYFLDDALPFGFPYLTFFPAVILTAFFAGVCAGLILGVACGLASWYFFIVPFDSFSLTGVTLLALLFYVFIVVTDVALIYMSHSALKQLSVEQQRTQKLAETNRAMFSEQQHRVSNNLQVISSMLKIQRRGITDPDAQQALDISIARLNTVSKIQRALHDPTNQTIDFARFLSEITPDVIEAAALSDEVGVTVNAAPLPVTPDQSIPLALIYTELVANALEHGLSGRDAMALVIKLQQQPDGTARLTVEDDGPGLPDGFTIASASSLGLSIARQFAAQLDGEFSEEVAEGRTRIHFSFPIAPLSENVEIFKNYAAIGIGQVATT